MWLLGRAQQAVRIFANGVSNERSRPAQTLHTAQQRMQREASVWYLFPAAIAPVGQTMAQTPHPLHCPDRLPVQPASVFRNFQSQSVPDKNRNLSNHESSGRGNPGHLEPHETAPARTRPAYRALSLRISGPAANRRHRAVRRQPESAVYCTNARRRMSPPRPSRNRVRS